MTNFSGQLIRLPRPWRNLTDVVVKIVLRPTRISSGLTGLSFLDPLATADYSKMRNPEVVIDVESSVGSLIIEARSAKTRAFQNSLFMLNGAVSMALVLPNKDNIIWS